MQKKLFAIKFEYQNVNHARAQIKETREKSVLRIDGEKQTLRKEISRLLQLRFDDLAKSLKALLDQTEVLNYEIYSGAGEQLRYQAAGGEGNLKERPQLKPEKDKSTTWSFKGEIWEDEYRSLQIHQKRLSTRRRSGMKRMEIKEHLMHSKAALFTVLFFFSAAPSIAVRVCSWKVLKKLRVILRTQKQTPMITKKICLSLRRTWLKLPKQGAKLTIRKSKFKDNSTKTN